MDGGTAFEPLTMVIGPGKVNFTLRPVWPRRKCASST